MKMIRQIKNLLRFHLPEAFREAAVGIAVDSLKQGSEAAIKEVIKKITNPHRAALRAFLLMLPDKKARDNFQRWHRESMVPPIGNGRPRDENRQIDLLVWQWLAVGGKEEEYAQDVFIKIGHFSDEEFRQYLYALENDAIPQWWAWVQLVLNERWEKIKPTVEPFGQEIDRAAKELAGSVNGLNEHLAQIRDEVWRWAERREEE